MKLPIYLDYAATTPVDPRVAQKMLEYLTLDGQFGNPASLSHAYGRAAKEAVDWARAEVAGLIHAEPSEIVWTSGATEAINLALKGAAQLYQRQGKHIITVKTEHKAVLDTCQQLEKDGFSVTYLTPEANGVIDLDKLSAQFRDDTILVSVMHVNNEIGVIQDIHAIASLTAERGILCHIDAAQSNGKIAIDVTKTPIDLLSMSSHKVYGPKGIGALYVRKKPRIRVAAQIHGGGQEQGMRSGTLATHQIMGMAEAYRIAKIEMAADYEKINQLRAMLLQNISGAKTILINGDVAQVYPGIINLRLPSMMADAFMNALPELAIAAGSACNAKGIEPSYVLRALGLSAEEAHCSVRLSFGRFTTVEEIAFASQCINKIVHS
jgi:cysteine desulfurase